MWKCDCKMKDEWCAGTTRKKSKMAGQQEERKKLVEQQELSRARWQGVRAKGKDSERLHRVTAVICDIRGQ